MRFIVLLTLKSTSSPMYVCMFCYFYNSKKPPFDSMMPLLIHAQFGRAT